MNPLDLIEGLPDALLSENPRMLADRVLVTLGKVVPVVRSALFIREQDHMQLYASRGVDQAVIDLVKHAWGQHRSTLEAGDSFQAAAGEPQASEPVSAAFQALAGGGALAIVPSRARAALVGVLYFDSLAAFQPVQLSQGAQLAALAAVALRTTASPAEALGSRSLSVDSYLERMPEQQIQRDQLLLLLTRNEWNIARVARILGVTRRTVYLRLERLGIRRERVPKVVPRRREAT